MIGVCSSDEDRTGGLCYPKCKAKYLGVGPVCWINSPSGWVDCGMGASPSSTSCALVVFDQVSSVGMLAINIATFGASGEAEIAANTAKSGKIINELTAKFKQLKELYDKNQKYVDLVKKGMNVTAYATTARQVSIAMTSDINTITAADIIRISAQMAALADPSGIAATIAAYSYPLCSDVKL